MAERAALIRQKARIMDIEGSSIAELVYKITCVLIESAKAYNTRKLSNAEMSHIIEFLRGNVSIPWNTQNCEISHVDLSCSVDNFYCPKSYQCYNSRENEMCGYLSPRIGDIIHHILLSQSCSKYVRRFNMKLTTKWKINYVPHYALKEMLYLVDNGIKELTATTDVSRIAMCIYNTFPNRLSISATWFAIDKIIHRKGSGFCPDMVNGPIYNKYHEHQQEIEEIMVKFRELDYRGQSCKLWVMAREWINTHIALLNNHTTKHEDFIKKQTNSYLSLICDVPFDFQIYIDESYLRYEIELNECNLFSKLQEDISKLSLITNMNHEMLSVFMRLGTMVSGPANAELLHGAEIINEYTKKLLENM